jgi:Ca-activated chloride channel family protein
MPASPKITRELDLLSQKLSLIESDPMLSRKRLSRESLRSSTNVYEGEDLS